MLVYHRRKGEPKGLSECDVAALLCAAHHQSHAPLVLVWDNTSGHISEAMQDFIDSHDWLTVYRLPTYAPKLNPLSLNPPMMLMHCGVAGREDAL